VAGRHTVTETAARANLASYSTGLGDRAVRPSLAEGHDRTCIITTRGRPRLTVNKVVVPATDPGRFNLRIDGNTVAANATGGASSGPQFVSPNVQHTVSETAGTGTSLANYGATIGGDCAANYRDRRPGQSKTCTI
jgi:hypothetical protein